jgi:hypothetical protein
MNNPGRGTRSSSSSTCSNVSLQALRLPYRDRFVLKSSSCLRSWVSAAQRTTSNTSIVYTRFV